MFLILLLLFENIGAISLLLVLTDSLDGQFFLISCSRCVEKSEAEKGCSEGFSRIWRAVTPMDRGCRMS